MANSEQSANTRSRPKARESNRTVSVVDRLVSALGRNIAGGAVLIGLLRLWHAELPPPTSTRDRDRFASYFEPDAVIVDDLPNGKRSTC